ncbi:calcyclin-binding protein [Diachasmimorpha longicaudata]|uniref:calcyclin-binding protein n=1 Tax=Diachasmimorpha longicaudata TaxID=58733 RepID=UPI0030B881C7
MALRTFDEVKLDIDDIETLLPQAKRQKTKDLLGLELRKLQTELVKLKDIERQANEGSKPLPTNSDSKCYTIKLTNYAWDDSDNFMKLYITLKNVHTLPAENITCDFEETSMHLRVNGLDKKNYHLPISNLCEAINPDKSYTKTKTDMIVVFLAKRTAKRWSHVSGIEKRLKEAKALPVPNMGDGDNAEAGLMNLMKKMYTEGDDDMKRTIAKAWTESQQKKGLSGPDFPNM